ncbi:MAG: M13 family metallopeptidase [Candidatus Micrarchaeota archaeon]
MLRNTHSYNISSVENAEDIGFKISNMDLHVDPFDDFYNYACGTWLKRRKIPKDLTRINSFYELENITYKKLKLILLSCINEPSKFKNGKLLADFYQSYIDIRTRERLKFSPIKYIIERIDALRSKDELPKLIAFLMLNAVNTFISFDPSPDEKNSSIYALHIYQSGLSLPEKSYYIEDLFKKVRSDFRKNIIKMFRLYGVSIAEAQRAADAVIKIETKIAKISRSEEELRDVLKNYNKMSINEFRRRFAYLNLDELLNGIVTKLPNYLIVGQPEFLSGLEKIIEEENIDDIKFYLKWHVLKSKANLLHKRAVKTLFLFFGKQLTGQKKMKPMWRRATNFIIDTIGDALSELYIKEYFDKSTEAKAVKLVNNIRKAFRKRLSNVAWMSPSTKKKALEKFDAMRVEIGYPAKFRDYSSIKSSKNDLVGNYIKAYQFELKRVMSRIGKKVDKKEWDMEAFTINAYYDLSMNKIVLPAGIFQPPFFDPNLDDAINYGGIGGVIGHELTHGFDDQGSKYDKYGNAKEWWTTKDREKFNEKAKEVEKLYSSLEVLPGIHVNGKLTLGENIADLGGIHIAYDALHYALNGKNPIIDGFTEEQRFFIAWAQIWKEKSTTKLKKLLAKVNPHPPGRFRGLIPVVTHGDFERVFKEKSKLNAPKFRYSDVNLW